MAELWQYITFPALAAVVVVLVGAMMAVTCMFMKKRELLCFRKKRRRPRRRKQKDDTESLIEMYHRDIKKPSAIKNRRSSNKDQQFFTDPFAKRFSDPFNLDHAFENFDISDWDNPLFDTETARQRDAAITIQSWWRMVKKRIRFLELREIALIFQKYWKGRQDRKKIPQLKKEKHERDQKRKKESGYIRNKGSLAALKFYDVKGYGFCEVQQLYGQETMHKAAEQLRSLYGGKGQRRFRLFISVKAVILYDYATWHHFATVKMSTISFCSLDFKNKKLFAFINMKKKRKFCHVFQCHEGDAQRLVETMGEAFEVTFKQEKQRKEEERLAAKRQQDFHESALELDKEVDQMMKLAESASLGTPSLHHKDDKSSPSPHSLRNANVYNNSPSLSSYQQQKNRTAHSPLLITNKIPITTTGPPSHHYTSSLDKGLDNIAHGNIIPNMVMVGERPRARTIM